MGTDLIGGVGGWSGRPTFQLRLRWGAGADQVALVARCGVVGSSAFVRRALMVREALGLAVASNRYQMIAGECRCRLLARSATRRPGHGGLSASEGRGDRGGRHCKLRGAEAANADGPRRSRSAAIPRRASRFRACACRRRCRAGGRHRGRQHWRWPMLGLPVRRARPSELARADRHAAVASRTAAAGTISSAGADTVVDQAIPVPASPAPGGRRSRASLAARAVRPEAACPRRGASRGGANGAHGKGPGADGESGLAGLADLEGDVNLAEATDLDADSDLGGMTDLDSEHDLADVGDLDGEPDLADVADLDVDLDDLSGLEGDEPHRR